MTTKQHEPSAIVRGFGPGTTIGMTTLIARPMTAMTANAIVNTRARASS